MNSSDYEGGGVLQPGRYQEPTGPCERPECGGDTHTDGWGNPIRCPRACSHTLNGLAHDAHDGCPGWTPDDDTRPEAPPQATPLEEAQATIESLRYQIHRAREALATDEPVACEPNCVHKTAVAELAQAIRLTREYVGEELLPPIEGWSWYDALRRHAPHELPASEEAP